MRALRIGLVGTRFAGLDGVTLESIKVADVLESLGHSVSWFGGRLDSRFSPGLEVPDAYFDTVANLRINHQVFGSATCPTEIHDEIEQRARALQAELARYVNELEVDVLMPQNASAIPMHLPLGVALARHVAETQIPAVAHHHDFGWERNRFWPNAVGDLLDEAFPPSLPSLGHLVISTLARDELSRRRGVRSRLLPNIMDFETPPAAGDSTRFRLAAGLSASDVVLLQPTRMVPRKGIEDTFDLAGRLNDPSICVVVTHPEPDEGAEYVEQLGRSAAELGVDFRVVPVGGDTGVRLADAYAAADLVTYPSRLEGFGNALLEAFYFRRPLLVNRYPVYAADIGPLGVAAIEMDGRVTDDVVAAVSRWLSDPGEWAGAVEENYEIGLQHFSYTVAAGILTHALADTLR
jgi:glycosyltransferase involved in cell wall biosynthesis